MKNNIVFFQSDSLDTLTEIVNDFFWNCENAYSEFEVINVSHSSIPESDFNYMQYFACIAYRFKVTKE